MSNPQINLRLRTDARPEQLLKELFFSPLIYLRLAGILFAIIVFGCVSDQVLDGDLCLYGALGVSNACNFAIAVGVIAFLICLVFLVKDFVMVITDFSGAMMVKNVVTMVDIIASGLWAFMWFVAFCYTADQRRRFTSGVATVRNCANSGVAFSFFSIIVWGAIIGVNVFFLVRIHKGQDRDSAGGGTGGGGYSSFPEGQGSGGGGGDDRGTEYAPPEY